MAWGGMAGGFGGWGGRPMGPAGVGDRLPFAGVPPELQLLTDKLQADEPPADLRDIPFTHVVDEHAPTFTLRRFLSPKWRPILAALALVAIETATLQAGPRLTQIGIDHGIARRNFHVVVLLTIVYLATVLGNAVVSAVRTAYAGRIGEDLLYGLRIRIFSHIQRLSLDFFTDEKAGRIMTRVTSDVDALQMLFQQGLINMLIQLFTLVFVVSQLFSMNVTLAVWVTFVIVPILTLLTLWFRSASDYGYLAVRDWVAAVLADLQENLSGIRIVAAFNRQRYNEVKHANIVGDYRNANIYTANVNAVYGPSAQAVGVIAQGLVLLIGGRMVLHNRLTIGELVAFILYLNSFFAPIQQLVQLYNTYQQGGAAIVKLRELFATAPSVQEAADASVLPAIDGAVRLEHVTFGYSPTVPVLEGVDLTIEAGETFALVGPTGAGKSTVAKLITRFYDPLAGRVLIDGHDVRTVTFASLRRQLGVVPQEPFLFAGTIGENIGFANPHATREELLEACRAVGIDDLVDGMAYGLDTPCHERGVTLSSGERQLIALARAFLAQPRVLVLDEATSSLDLATEAMIERALDALLEGRTAILIAHRLNTAMRADRIGVIDHGRLVEVGAHAELLARGGRYSEMFAAWRMGQQATAPRP